MCVSMMIVLWHVRDWCEDAVNVGSDQHRDLILVFEWIPGQIARGPKGVDGWELCQNSWRCRGVYIICSCLVISSGRHSACRESSATSLCTTFF
jgi:hypothetical protein